MKLWRQLNQFQSIDIHNVPMTIASLRMLSPLNAIEAMPADSPLPYRKQKRRYVIGEHVVNYLVEEYAGKKGLEFLKALIDIHLTKTEEEYIATCLMAISDEK